jgi:hypothetical protein
MPNIFYNYIYCNPLKPGPYKVKGIDLILPAEPFYVGRGKGKRKDVHTKFAVYKNGRYGVNEHKNNTIRQILSANLKPIVIQINANLPNFIANDNERYLVRVIGRADLGKGPLTNLTDAGETSAGYKMKPESIAKSVAARRANGNITGGFAGKSHTPESNEKNRQAHLGRVSHKRGIKCTPEQVERNRQSHTGLKQSTETKEIKRQLMLDKKWGKPVLQFDLSGNFITEYHAIAEAKRITGITGISQHLNGNNSHAGGYLWKYKIN